MEPDAGSRDGRISDDMIVTLCQCRQEGKDLLVVQRNLNLLASFSVLLQGFLLAKIVGELLLAVRLVTP